MMDKQSDINEKKYRPHICGDVRLRIFKTELKPMYRLFTWNII